MDYKKQYITKKKKYITKTIQYEKKTENSPKTNARTMEHGP